MEIFIETSKELKMSGDEKLWEWIQKEEDEVEKERIREN